MARASTFRRWWQPPARFEDRSVERRVSFLELFFDLVFVVLISQLSHRLAEHPSWSGVGWFTFLFYIVWSSWTNGTMYYDLHGTNDVSMRVFTFLQMMTVAVMAVFAGSVPGPASAGFALAHAVNLALLAVIWFRTGLHDPSHRAASNPYSGAYMISALLFAGSALVAEPGRYWMWVIALLVEISGQVVAFRRWTPPESQGGVAVIATSPSLIERMGLFVIIVLGEVIVGAISGMADLDPLTRDDVVIGLLGVLVAIGLWWIYFDLISGRAPHSHKTQLWSNLHFPLVVAIAAGGAGVLSTVEQSDVVLADPVRWLLVGSLAAANLSLVAISLTLQMRDLYPDVYRVAEAVLLLSALLMVGVGFTDWGAKATLGVMVALLLAPVVMGIMVWLKHTEPGDLDLVTGPQG